MELAQLLITPGTLLTAFIFFWKQAKLSSDELKREIKEDLKQATAKSDQRYSELKADLKAELKQAVASNDLLYRELKVELKEEIMSLRQEVSSIRVEMHDMNGRLGRVEGLLVNPDGGGS